MASLESLRQEYVNNGLDESDVVADPIEQFDCWFSEMRQNLPGDWFEPNAMTLATSSSKGHVTARVVLLKIYDQNGFVFFTNYDSEKGNQIAGNPQVALCLHWPFLQRQVRIEGSVTRVSDDLSEEYFQSRPRGSQIGAVASHQSQPIVNRSDLARRANEIEEQYAGQAIPRPKNWGGYRVSPIKIEFWQGRQNRLHDRLVYSKTSNGWTLGRAAP